MANETAEVEQDIPAASVEAGEMGDAELEALHKEVAAFQNKDIPFISHSTYAERGSGQVYRDIEAPQYEPVQPTLTKAEEIRAWLTENLHKMTVPFAYLGDEPNTYKKDWSDPKNDWKICLIGAMGYTSSEGNLAVPLIYAQQNHERPQYVTERCFFVNSRDEFAQFRAAGLPFFSIETKHPLKDFDVLAFSVSYIMPFAHIAPMLHYSGINVWTNDRKEEDPIVIVGGCMSYVAEIVCGGRGGVVDCVFIGESEEYWNEGLDLMREMRKAGAKKDDILFALTTKFHGFYVPKFYDVEYDTQTNEIVRRVPLREGVPNSIRKAYNRNMNEGFILTDPFVSYAGGMAMGHLEIARGCSSACNFCQEGFNYRPYRERDKDVVVEAARELMEKTGAVDITPASFTSSDHHQVNTLIKDLLEKVSDSVSIVSQRADAFGLDPTFAHLTGLGGSKTVSVGMEGVSQRMRDIMTKAVTEENLLRTVEFAFRANYKSIKFFMITNVPGTTDADYEEFLEFMDKVHVLREEYAPKCEVKFSFTPLFISGLTPFQWHHCTVDDRTLTPWIRKIKDKGFGFRLGSGARFDESYLSQVFHVADRRLTEVMVKAALEDNFMHFGTTSKGTVQKWEAHMEPHRVSFAFYFQEKPEDWNFSWDHVDNLTRKDALLSEYKRSRQAMGHLKPCIEECYKCGACDREIWDQRTNWEQRKIVDGQSIDVTKVNVIRQSGNAMRARLRIAVKPSHRFIDRDHWRLQVRRASYMNKIPIDKHKIMFASDTIKMFNWISGVDYVDVQLIDHRYDPTIFTSDEFNGLLTGIKVTKAQLYTDMKRIRSIQDLCLYEIPATKSPSELQDSIDRWLAMEGVPEGVELPNEKTFRKADKIDRKVKSAFLKQYPTTARIKKMGNKGIERVIVDFRPLVDDMWVVETKHGPAVRILSRGVASPYDTHALVFKERFKVGVELPAMRLEFLIEQEDDQDDMFVDRCQECDKLIEQNIFGVAVSSDYCLKHMNTEAVYTIATPKYLADEIQQISL